MLIGVCWSTSSASHGSILCLVDFLFVPDNREILHGFWDFARKEILRLSRRFVPRFPSLCVFLIFLIRQGREETTRVSRDNASYRERVEKQSQVLGSTLKIGEYLFLYVTKNTDCFGYGEPAGKYVFALPIRIDKAIFKIRLVHSLFSTTKPWTIEQFYNFCDKEKKVWCIFSHSFIFPLIYNKYKKYLLILSY